MTRRRRRWGVSERTFRRWRERYAEGGPEGLVDRRVGRPSPRRAPEAELQRMLRLYHDYYQGFTVRHFHDKLRQRHGYRLGDTTTRLWLQKAGLVRPAPRRGAHRRKRPRRPMIGMLLHQDASRHAWLAGPPPLDLVVTLDDATSEIYSAFPVVASRPPPLRGWIGGPRPPMVEEEGTASSFRGLAEVIARHGLFIELYTDRGSHYFHTPAAGGKVSRSQLTQVGRALRQLGIGHIAAYSPEARGRSERAFRTLQDRLPKELALAGITTLEGANHYLREVYLAEPDARFATPADDPASAFVRVPAELWRDVLCVQEERQVGNDNCVRWKGRSLQIPPSPLRPHLVRATVRLHEHPDGSIAIFKGPQRLASFSPPAKPAGELAA